MSSPRYPVSIFRAPLTARIEIAGRTEELSAVLKAAGLPVPKSLFTASTGAGDVRVAWLGPRRMVVTAPNSDHARLFSALRAAVPVGKALALADVTGATATFVLEGSGVNDVLAQGFAHDVSGAATGKVFAADGWGTAAVIERRDDGGIAVTVDATFADYIDHMLHTAAGHTTTSKPGVMSAPPPGIRVGR